MKFKVDHGIAFVERMPGGSYYLSSIIVDAGHRGQGIGTELMKKVLKGTGRPLYLLVSSELDGDYKKLVRFYKKFGFEKITKDEKKDIDTFPYRINMGLWE